MGCCCAKEGEGEPLLLDQNGKQLDGQRATDSLNESVDVRPPLRIHLPIDPPETNVDTARLVKPEKKKSRYSLAHSESDSAISQPTLAPNSDYKLPATSSSSSSTVACTDLLISPVSSASSFPPPPQDNNSNNDNNNTFHAVVVPAPPFTPFAFGATSATPLSHSQALSHPPPLLPPSSSSSLPLPPSSPFPHVPPVISYRPPYLSSPTALSPVSQVSNFPLTPAFLPSPITLSPSASAPYPFPPLPPVVEEETNTPLSTPLSSSSSQTRDSVSLLEATTATLTTAPTETTTPTLEIAVTTTDTVPTESTMATTQKATEATPSF